MSGPEELPVETTKGRLQQLESLLNDYTRTVGIDIIPYNPVEVAACLALSYERLNKLSEEECAGHAFILSKYAAYLQKEYNRNNVRLNWANTNLNGLLAKAGEAYGNSYVKHEIKLAALCNNDASAQQLNQIKIHAEARILELADMAKHMSLISETLKELRRTKRKYNHDST